MDFTCALLLQVLTSTPLVLLGLRLQVYRAEGTTQWFTTVATQYNEPTREFSLTDDTVLEEHFEDPRLTQMQILGDGGMHYRSSFRQDRISLMVGYLCLQS